MNPERFRRVDQVFQQALSQPRERLQSYLEEACYGDEDLRREVESLLENGDLAGSFLNSPVPDSLATDQAKESQPEFVRRTLLHYRIVEKTDYH